MPAAPPPPEPEPESPVAAAAGADESQNAELVAEEPRLGLYGDIVDELSWTLHGRKGWLFGLAFNLVTALVFVGFQRYDPHRSGDLRIANIGIAVVLYFLADVVNTNQLGSDRDRVLASLGDGDTVRRILIIKNLSLAVLLVPLALLVSLLVRILVGRWRVILHPVLTDVGAVFLWLGVGSVISVLLPYRPIAIRARVKQRRTWPRWGFCQAVPYAAYFVLVPLLHLPYAAVYHYRLLGSYVPHYVVYSLVYLAIGAVYWGIGLALADRYAKRRLPRLMTDLRREV
jgi:hypothetical protein